MASLGIATAPFLAVDTAGSDGARGGPARPPRDLEDAALRLRRQRPDGDQGGHRPRRRPSARSAASECILEGVVPFLKEISVDLRARPRRRLRRLRRLRERARAATSCTARTAPAALLPRKPPTEAVTIAQDDRRRSGLCRRARRRVLRDDRERRGRRCAVNEIAPRVHNSGTLDGGRRRHLAVRAAHPRDLPAGRSASTRRGTVRSVEMRKPDRRRKSSDMASAPRRADGVSLHLYGKEQAPRPGRKMGHWTRVRGGYA